MCVWGVGGGGVHGCCVVCVHARIIYCIYCRHSKFIQAIETNMKLKGDITYDLNYYETYHVQLKYV